MELCKNHPGINDSEYLSRREYFHNIVSVFNNQGVGIVEYTDSENNLWNLIYQDLKQMHNKYACTSYLKYIELLEEKKIFTAEKIPQIKEINNFLFSKTKFRLKPVNGLISSREFLNSLADRVFNCTLYIRHKSKPFYTPEPDLVHEFLGHVPLFADLEFADLSEKIGKASLYMNDEELLKLTRFYWFTIEFGLCKEGNKNKVYGAGILSSLGEIEYSLSKESNVKDFKVSEVVNTDYPTTEYQPIYYRVNSFEDAKKQLLEYIKYKN